MFSMGHYPALTLMLAAWPPDKTWLQHLIDAVCYCNPSNLEGLNKQAWPNQSDSTVDITSRPVLLPPLGGSGDKKWPLWILLNQPIWTKGVGYMAIWSRHEIDICVVDTALCRNHNRHKSCLSQYYITRG